MLDYNIDFDEASFYFRDSAYEHPPLFPRVSRVALVEASSVEASARKEGVPHKILLTIDVSNISPMTVVSTGKRNGEARRYMDQETKNPDSWMDKFVADDESSCGTLDYSVDTFEEQAVMQVQSAMTRVAYGHSRRQSGVPATVGYEEFISMDKEINRALISKFDVHARRSVEDNCLFGWVTAILHRLGD